MNSQPSLSELGDMIISGALSGLTQALPEKATPERAEPTTQRKPKAAPVSGSDQPDSPINWKSETAEVLEWVNAQSFPQAEVERVGNWVWVTFPDKPDLEIRQALSASGFHYNGKWRSWQHPCNHPSRHGKGDPRDKYEVEKIS